MRLTLSQRYRDTVSGSHRAVSRAVLCLGRVQFTTEPVGLELPILTGDVKLNSTSDVKGTLQLDVPGEFWDKLQPYGAEVFVERGVEWAPGDREMVPIGYYRIKEVSQDRAPYGPVTVSAESREARLVDDRLIYPYQVPTGSTHRSVFEALINGAEDSQGNIAAYPTYIGATVPIDWSEAGYNPDTPVSSNLIAEEGKLDFLSKLIDPYGAVIVFQPDGSLGVVQRDPLDTAVGRVRDAAAAILAALADTSITVLEDWTWIGAPDVVTSTNDYLISEFATAEPGADPRGAAGIAFLTEVAADGPPALPPPDWEIRGGRGGNLIRASRKTTREGVYNIVRAVGSDPAVQTGYRLAYITDESSPLWWQGPFGAVVRYYASPLLQSGDQANKAAETILKRVTGLPSGLSLYVVPNPAIRPLNLLRSTIGREAAEMHVADQVTIPLASAAEPEVVTRTLNPGDTTPGDPNDPSNPGTPTDPGTGGPGDPTDPGTDPDPGDPGTGPGGDPDPTDGTQAAVARNWGPVIDGDEFNYTGMPGGKWGLYDGAGHDGNGIRTPNAFNVHDGIMTIHGENGATGGTAFARDEMGYRVECRVRVYNTGDGGDRFHPVLILWPASDDWPAGAEYDFFETDEGTGTYTGYLHLPNHEPYRQDQIPERQLDLENWHNYACEWDPNAQILRCFLDGEMTYEGLGRVAQAPGPMHLTIQLDNFGGNPRPCNMDIAWVRIYQRPNA
jgi:hypothetical protein